jgi:hypothetical protein
MTQDTGEPIVGFERDVKPLFRERDRRSMLGTFDLWSYDDVRANADAILDRVSDGSMPCDTAWTPEQVDLLQRWIVLGMPD